MHHVKYPEAPQISSNTSKFVELCILDIVHYSTYLRISKSTLKYSKVYKVFQINQLSLKFLPLPTLSENHQSRIIRCRQVSSQTISNSYIANKCKLNSNLNLEFKYEKYLKACEISSNISKYPKISQNILKCLRIS